MTIVQQVEQLSVGLPNVKHFLPQQKAAIDAEAFSAFLSGRNSAFEISNHLSQSYHNALTEAVRVSGLAEFLLSHDTTLVTVGGSAKQTTAVHSDWDLAILCKNGVESLPWNPIATDFADLVWKGIDIRFGMRSPDDIAGFFTDPRGIDIQSISSLFAMNLVCGNPDEMHKFSALRDELIVKYFPQLFSAFEHSVRTREDTSGSLFKLAEFNLKEARGGLRDIDVIYFIDHMCSCVGLASGMRSGERAQIESAREVLMRAKHALHFSFKGKHSDAINIWDYARRENILRLFKGECGQAMSSVEVYELVYKSAQLVKTVLDQMFDQVADQLEVPAWRQPRSLNYCFIEPTGLGDLFKGTTPVSDTVRKLYECGNLSRMLPEFAESEFYVDSAGFHAFSLGEHHIRTLAEVERLLGRDSVLGRDSGWAALSDVRLKTPNDRAPLLLAALHHDIGKIDDEKGGDHSLLGAERIPELALRLGFSPEQGEKAAKLVRDHMLIADVAGHSRFNLITDEVISRIPDIEYLQELLILTLADKKESNPLAWTARRRDSLISGYHQLRIALDKSQNYQDRLSAHVAERLRTSDLQVDDRNVESYVRSIAPHVLGCYTPEILAEKFRLLTKFRENIHSGEAPFIVKVDLVRSEHKIPGEYKMNIFFVAPDSDGLLARVSSYLTAAGRGLSLSSALVDTQYLSDINQKIACDFLSVQSSDEIEFFDGEQERFINGLRRAVLGIGAPVSLSNYLTRTALPPNSLEGQDLMPMVNVELLSNMSSNTISLIVSDRLRRDVFPLITPIFTRNNLGIINAQIGCGNRGIRHFFELQAPSAGEIDINQLKAEIDQAFCVLK